MSDHNLEDGDDEQKPKPEKEPAPRASGARARASSIVIPPLVTKPILRFMPTYRMEPKVPVNREKCEKIIKAVMNRAFENYSYTPRTALNYCCQVAEEIKNRVKAQGYDRYRYVVLVSVGEKLWQSYYTYINFLWDETKDGYVSHVCNDPKFFAIATLFYLYYD